MIFEPTEFFEVPLNLVNELSKIRTWIRDPFHFGPMGDFGPLDYYAFGGWNIFVWLFH